MKEIRRILKEETAIPENIDKAMEDVLSGILNSPDEKTTGALSKKTNGERTKIQEIRKNNSDSSSGSCYIRS